MLALALRLFEDKRTQSLSTATVLAVAANFSTPASRTSVVNNIHDKCAGGDVKRIPKQTQDTATGIRCHTGSILAKYLTND